MPHFTYTARHPTRGKITGTIEAQTKAAAMTIIGTNGAVPISINEHSSSADPTALEAAGNKKCPYCGEDIRMEAIKCKHCGEFMDQHSTATYIPQEKVIIKEQTHGCLWIFIIAGGIVLALFFISLF